MPTEVDSLLARVSATYAACPSYRDSGTATTTFYSPRKHTNRQPFSTRFVRPDRFLFEFRSRRGEEEWNQYAIWIEGGIRSWWSIRDEDGQPESLSLALAGATGVSKGVAALVPRLLMPELLDGRSMWPRSPRLIDVSEAAALGLVVVESTRHDGSSEQMWIHPSTFLIHRVVRPRHPMGPPPREAIEHLRASHPERADELSRRVAEMAQRDPTEVEQVTVYEAVFDVRIADDELRFVPPTE